MKNLKLGVSLFSVICLFMVSCTSTEAQTAKSDKVTSSYEIASDEYVEIAKKSLAHVEKFEFSKWYEMMSEDIEYYLPDGDEGTRTALKGKKAVMEFWNGYQEKSGNDKLIISKPTHIPVVVKKMQEYSKVSGATVISYFSAEFHYGAETANVRMNWAFAFDTDKKISKIYTYYDRTPIIEAAKKNFLTKSEE